MSRKELWQLVTQSMNNSGFREAGTAFEGTVVGFVNGNEKFAMKIDQTGEVLHLSLFNSRGAGSAYILHGAVFGKFYYEKIN